jgi:hypothetical protein
MLKINVIFKSYEHPKLCHMSKSTMNVGKFKPLYFLLNFKPCTFSFIFGICIWHLTLFGKEYNDIWISYIMT